MRKYTMLSLAICSVLVVHSASSSAFAKGPMPPFGIDKHHRHGGFYPKVGFHVNVLPSRHFTVRYNSAPYYYSAGVWYHRGGLGFAVIAPPVGIIAPILPPAYTTIWYGGTPYYYGNNCYYVWKPDRNGYMVVEPPDGVVNESQPILAQELYVYPKEGQSEQQRADDRFACHQWANKETGYDPTHPAKNVSVVALSSSRENYQRALKACLEGRGYSVR